MTGDPAEMSQAEFLYWESECEKRGLIKGNRPMAEPIREAAKRLQSNDREYWFSIDHAPEAAKDARLCAEFVLATVPANSELPVTEEWLRSIGFARHETGIGCWNLYLEGLNYCGQDNRWVWPPDCYKQPKSRGDVRRLCTALGINIPIEPKKPKCIRCNDKGYYHEQSEVGQHYLQFDCSCRAKTVPIEPKGGGKCES